MSPWGQPPDVEDACMGDAGNVWDAEEIVSIELAGELIARTAPELAGCDVEYFGEGWDNTGYLVRDRSRQHWP